MKRLFSIAAAALAATGAAGALAQGASIKALQFNGGPVQTAQLSKESAVVYGDDGAALFRGNQGFVLGFAGNAAGRVFEWDVARHKVRISADGQPGAWLACDDLKAMPIACAASFRLAPDGDLVVDAAPGVSTAGGPTLPRGTRGGPEPTMEPLGRGVPNCPGDPRCPKLGGG